METDRQKYAIEAILFAAGDPIGADKIAQALELDLPTTETLLEEVRSAFNQRNHGVQIVRLGDGYQMCSSPDYGEEIRRVLDLRKNTPLSTAAMEVLAIVAYNQPVTKAFVEQVRGVDCSGVLGSLMTKGLLEERGRLELPGRPLLYGTTPDFLRCMNLSSLEELPPLPQSTEEADSDSAAESEETSIQDLQ